MVTIHKSNWKLLWWNFSADFSGPAETSTFPLGSMIPIMASVEAVVHQPLLLLLEECVAATTSDLEIAVETYTIITNKGYFN